MTDLLVDGLTVSMRERTILDRFSLRVASGEVVALIGPNGAGKTTLLRSILGLVTPTAGSVRLDGIESCSLSATRRATLVAHLTQHTVSDDALTVLEYVSAARYRFAESRSASQKAAELALARVDAAELVEQRWGTLSGGERQRVAIAALLAQEAGALLLDEPGNHLDPARQAQTYALLGALQQLRTTMVIVTHDINLVCVLGSPEQVRIVGMQQGRNAFDLPYGAPQLCDQLTALYGVPMRRVHDGERTFFTPVLARRP